MKREMRPSPESRRGAIVQNGESPPQAGILGGPSETEHSTVAAPGRVLARRCQARLFEPTQE
jgi:hypothetical protein